MSLLAVASVVWADLARQLSVPVPDEEEAKADGQSVRNLLCERRWDGAASDDTVGEVDFHKLI